VTGPTADESPRLDDRDDRKAVILDDFRLDFAWVGDRWAHALQTRAGPDWSPLARAVEGSVNGDDPTHVVGPAYQQFHWQADGGRAMLLGQSGPHHFSAVFAVRRDGGAIVVDVELADRCRAAVAALACTYTVESPPAELVEAESGHASWERSGSGRLTFEAIAPARVAVAEAGRHRTRVQAVAALDPTGQTHRCSYRWHYQAPRGRGIGDPA
jgi:hypothetical protein